MESGAVKEVEGGHNEHGRKPVPTRLSWLPFSCWHWLVIDALGITWMLDGLKVMEGLLRKALRAPFPA
jgi:hypothetical protein